MATTEQQLKECCGELIQQLIDNNLDPADYVFFAAYDIKLDLELNGNHHKMFGFDFHFKPCMQYGDVILMKKERQWTSYK